MTNKLVVIINSLKVPKIKKILLYEMKFLVPNYSCLQNPWLGGPTAPRSPFSFSSTEFVEHPPPLRTKFLGTPLSVVSSNALQGSYKGLLSNINLLIVSVYYVTMRTVCKPFRLIPLSQCRATNVPTYLSLSTYISFQHFPAWVSATHPFKCGQLNHRKKHIEIILVCYAIH